MSLFFVTMEKTRKHTNKQKKVPNHSRRNRELTTSFLKRLVRLIGDISWKRRLISEEALNFAMKSVY